MDPKPLAAQHALLLEQAGFLRALSRALSFDEPEELEQATWLVALQRPPRDPGTLRAWLARVARNLAAGSFRSAARRAARLEALSPREEVPSAAELAERRESIRRLLAAVDALPGPFQTALQLRYFEDLPPRAIAERLGEPVATVKSRLKRALTRLRELLDESHGGDRKRWLMGLAPLLALDAPGAIVPGAAAGTGAATTMLIGGIAMKKLLLAAAGVLLLVLLLVSLQMPLFGPEGAPGALPSGPLAAAASPPPETQPEEPRKPVGAPEAAPVFHPQPADGWLVEVVRRRKDLPGGEAFEPVPDARVCVVGWEEISNQVVGTWLSMDDAAWLSMRDAAWILSQGDRNLGRSYLADSRGRVRIPQVGGPSLLLLGRHQGERGSLILQPGRFPPFRLELQPDAVLRVHVVDQKGRPLAGVPVYLQSSPRIPRSISPSFETAGPEGVVEIHGIQKAVTSTNPRLFVFLGVPLAAPVFAEIDPGALPIEPVRLVMPPTGSVRLDLPAPSLKDKEFLLARLGRTKDPSWEKIDGAFLQPKGTGIPLARAQGGQIRFPYVGLGLELEIRVLRYSSAIYSEGGQLTRVDFGPTAPGQEVVFRFEDPPTIPVFSGRVVDERGKPVARRWFSFAVEGQPSNREKSLSNIVGNIILPITDSSMGMTDGTGRFLRPIPSNPGNDPLALRVTEAGGVNEPRLSGSRQFPTPIPDTGFDIGDVQVRPLPLLAAGTVVDEEERPIPGAALIGLFPMGPRGAFPISIRTRTDAEGRFRLYATLTAGEFEVMVVMLGYDRARQTIATGAAEIRLVLRRAAGYFGVEGSVILPAGALPEQFYALLKDPGPDGNARHLPIDADGRFSFISMNHEEGLKDLSIHLDFFPGGKLFQVDGISLEKGRVNRDPRLQQIDLGRLVQAVELEVVDAQGAPIPRTKVAVKSSEGPFRDLLKFRSYLLPQGEQELRVSAPGFRPTVFQVPPLRRQVVLQRGLDVRLRLEPQLPPREAGILVAFALEGPGLDFQGEEAEEPAGGFRFCLHGPGRHEVTARLSLTASGSPSFRPFRVTDPAWIEVEERAGTQVFPLRLDLAALRRAMEEMKAMAR